MSDITLDDLSASLRGIIAAAPGYDLIGADFTAIEGRVCAWLAGQQDKLDAFTAYDLSAGQPEDARRLLDIYVRAAKQAASADRQLGKVMELALQFGMGPIKFRDTAKLYGIKLPLKDARRIAIAWRKANSCIVGLWNEVEHACTAAINNRGKRFDVGSFLQVAADQRSLMVKLPSGRRIYYWRPSLHQTKKVVQTVDEEGEIIDIERDSVEIRFFTPAKDATNMTQESTYSGKLVENVTQAVARDLLAHAVVNLEAAGYPVAVHVHDSIACEIPAGTGSVEEFCKIMAQAPSWAPGLPLAAAGYRDRRFRG